jgi:hypothetical protein
MQSTVNDPMTPGFTFPLLTATITNNTNSTNNTEKPVMCNAMLIPCPHAGCTGQLSNDFLPEQITEDREDANLLSYYPDVLARIHALIPERQNNELSKKIAINYESYPETDIDSTWDNDNIVEPVGLLRDYTAKTSTMISCNVCNNWYIVCLKCRTPCYIKAFCGAFSEDKFNPDENKYDSAGYVELCRKTVTCLDNTGDEATRELIGIHKPSENVEFKSVLPNIIVKSVKEWRPPKPGTGPDSEHESESESEEESFDEDDWRYWYNVLDKGAIWARDPRLNLYVDNSRFRPLLCGTDGGFDIEYLCRSCQSTYSFTDK